VSDVKVRKLEEIQFSGLYRIAGWAAKQVKKLWSCENCTEVLTVTEPVKHLPHHFLTSLEKLNLKKKYNHPSEIVFQLLVYIEERVESILHHYENTRNLTDIATSFLIKLLPNEILKKFPTCHPKVLVTLLVKQFLKLRSSIYTKDKNKKEVPSSVAYAGKTAYMKTAADTYNTKTNNKRKLDFYFEGYNKPGAAATTTKRHVSDNI
jgi:hypothetical protein